MVGRGARTAGPPRSHIWSARSPRHPDVPGAQGLQSCPGAGSPRPRLLPQAASRAPDAGREQGPPRPPEGGGWELLSGAGGGRALGPRRWAGVPRPAPSRARPTAWDFTTRVPQQTPAKGAVGGDASGGAGRAASRTGTRAGSPALRRRRFLRRRTACWGRWSEAFPDGPPRDPCSFSPLSTPSP